MTPVDVVVIILILMTSVGLILKAQPGKQGPLSKTATARVYHDGKLSHRFPLSRNQERVLLEGKMVLEIKDRRMRVRRSDCPRQLCVQQGWVKYDGESIICVPYKTLIEIKSKQKPVVDAVVY